MKGIDVYLEVGAKRVFACAVDWPGWCRSGPDEAGALQALIDYGPKYAKILRSTRLGFQAPKHLDELSVVERLEGNATTDFGAPGVIPACDHVAATKADYTRFEKILGAAWRALDAAHEQAQGKELRKGPRGGGRELEAILKHVMESDAGYLGAFGWKFKPSSKAADRLEETREAIRAALEASAQGQIAATGPRGGVRWPVRYFVRRVAWHAIAHAWEIERRVVGVESA